jgi:Diguanylate cyclase, GGDEF domain
MRQLYPSFRRFLFAIGAFTVCMLALAGFAADALGVDGFSATGRHRTLVARAEEPALAFIVAVGCLITASSALRGNRRKPVPDEAQVRQLAAQARTDSLTGLGNHRAFEENLSATIAARASTGAPFVLLALDVDGLKEINDTHGHLAGDARIKLVANYLRDTVASSAPSTERAATSSWSSFPAAATGTASSLPGRSTSPPARQPAVARSPSA